MKTGYLIIKRMTTAEIAAGNIPAGFVEEVDANGQPTGDLYLVDATGIPQAVQSAANTIQNNYTATTAPTSANDSTQGYAVGSRWIDITNNESYVCTKAINPASWSQTTVGSISEVSGLQGALDAKSATTHNHAGTYEPANANIQSHVTSAHAPATAEQNVNADWSAASGDAQILNKPTTMTPSAHTHTESEVTNLTTDLAAKQATLVSGTNIKTVNGASVLGSGNVSVAADLPGGSATTALDDGLDAGNSTIDRATVAGQTILKYENTVGTSTFKVPLNVTSIWAFAVGGGGSGGGGVGGGGGGGRFVENNAITVTPGTSYVITVGAGGASVGDGVNGNSGQSSSIGSLLIASGGGGGGFNNAVGASGASGGGGGCNGFAGGTATAGTSTGGASPDTTGFGFAGGAGANNGSTYEGGGGGGAGAVGSPASPGTGVGGNGGVGRSTNITGTSLGYAGGGGGGQTNGQTGTATDGGGSNGASGTANRGGGGGSTGNSVATGAGGSGIIIIRFATQSRSYQALTSYADNSTAVAAGKLVGEFYKKTSDGSVQQVV